MIDRTLCKFLLVGVLNTFIGGGIIFFLYNIADLGYWGSSVIGYIFASLVSFFLNKHFVFMKKHQSFEQLIKFGLTIAVCYLVAYGLAKPLVFELLPEFSEQTRNNVSLAVGITIFTFLNYITQKMFVFR